ncbi:MAG: hypothetical protein KC442_19960 [Thermomicrobiales bacterium]|nr:hypothetical protein [Thermomicrobiales bacterium]
MRGHDLGSGLSRRSMAAAVAAGALALRGRQTSAGKKSCQKKARKKVDRTCGRQVDECVASFTVMCEGTPNPADCVAAYVACCASLGACDFTGHHTCLNQLR